MKIKSNKKEELFAYFWSVGRLVEALNYELSEIID